MDRVFWFTLVGLTVGLLANMLMSGGRLGALGDTVMGILGALGGGFLFRYLAGESGGLWGSMIAAAIGGALLIYDMRLLQKSFAERQNRLAVWRHCTSLFRRSLAMPRRTNGEIEICRVCGHRHLL